MKNQLLFLIGDNSASYNMNQLLIDIEDPNIVSDLRCHNGIEQSKFDVLGSLLEISQ